MCLDVIGFQQYSFLVNSAHPLPPSSPIGGSYVDHMSRDGTGNSCEETKESCQLCTLAGTDSFPEEAQEGSQLSPLNCTLYIKNQHPKYRTSHGLAPSPHHDLTDHPDALH